MMDSNGIKDIKPASGDVIENDDDKISGEIVVEGPDVILSDSNQGPLKRNLGNINLLAEENENQKNKGDNASDIVVVEPKTPSPNLAEQKKETPSEETSQGSKQQSRVQSPKSNNRELENKSQTPRSETEKSESDENPGQIFSVGGNIGMKFTRHRDQVTVFPSGCMGIMGEEQDLKNKDGRRFLQPNEIQERDSGHLDSIPHKRPPSARNNVIARNPLTGEGYEDTDFISGSRKRDMKTVVDQTKKSPKATRVPPGGFSTPLW